MSVHGLASHGVWGGQRTICRNRFSSCTTGMPSIKLRTPGFMVTTESSWWPPFHFLKKSNESYTTCSIPEISCVQLSLTCGFIDVCDEHRCLETPAKTWVSLPPRSWRESPPRGSPRLFLQRIGVMGRVLGTEGSGRQGDVRILMAALKTPEVCLRRDRSLVIPVPSQSGHPSNCSDKVCLGDTAL